MVKQKAKLFLEHTLGLSDVRLAVEISCRQNDLTITGWVDEKTIKSDYDRVQVGKKKLAILPDAYFTVETPTPKTLHFFLEYDRATEGLRAFNQKISAYLTYFRTGKSKARFGTDLIRVLTVAEGGQTRQGTARIANLKEGAENLNARSRYWFSTLAQVASEDILRAPIWGVASRSKPTSLISS